MLSFCAFLVAFGLSEGDFVTSLVFSVTAGDFFATVFNGLLLLGDVSVTFDISGVFDLIWE